MGGATRSTYDNFFTSKALLCDLEQLMIFGIGTTRTDRKHFPEDLKKIKFKTR